MNGNLWHDKQLLLSFVVLLHLKNTYLMLQIMYTRYILNKHENNNEIISFAVTKKSAIFKNDI